MVFICQLCHSLPLESGPRNHFSLMQAQHVHLQSSKTASTFAHAKLPTSQWRFRMCHCTNTVGRGVHHSILGNANTLHLFFEHWKLNEDRPWKFHETDWAQIAKLVKRDCCMRWTTASWIKAKLHGDTWHWATQLCFCADIIVAWWRQHSRPDESQTQASYVRVSDSIDGTHTTSLKAWIADW